ncbi:uncharacterized protein PV09_00922 [Verruconis gallopava]|uniref:Conserved oligomeric Golgi complex subunit 8 n=1 Tax=Verruconis gallopava TaxID=253628 RepID=A0A0D2BCF7_9PEZI|nr:uncharacterized protein PV09_00922 [Verruconis gallopava]KIW09029.1 hypothetical protein PV09_00922 [Verruconis gallopava]
MGDPLYELLTPYFDALDTPARPLATDPTTTKYLNHLTNLSLSDLVTTESATLSQQSHTTLRSLQSLSKRSYKSIISSATHLSNLNASLPQLLKSTQELRDAGPEVEASAAKFSDKYRRTKETDNDVLAKRRKALLLLNNCDRILNILDLSTLLSTAISSASQPGATSGSVNYASALDLHAHIKRLATLYPHSPLVSSIVRQSEQEMRHLTTNLIISLQAQNVKLASAMRTIGWLRRVAPELDDNVQFDQQPSSKMSMKNYFGNTDGALGAVLLICRLKNMIHMLDALEPLRELADHETKDRLEANKKKSTVGVQPNMAILGQQTERYLKRYIEIFREQSFAIVSMYKSIFPSALPAPGSEGTNHSPENKKDTTTSDHLLLPLPSPLATFPPHLVDMLFETLREYLPNVQDRQSRDSLLTQVLYCAGSLGRLGGDFSMMLAFLEDGDNDNEEESWNEREREWVDVMKKHRIQASKLELLASGVGAGRPPILREDSPTVPIS